MTRTCIVVALALGILVLSAVGAARNADHQPPADSHPAASQPATEPAKERLRIGGEDFDLELAATPAAREHGLMNRDHIDVDGGMLFIYPHPQLLAFWMKNCPIEMDILFVNDRGVIVATHRMQPAPSMRPRESEDEYNARLPRYDSRRPAQFAIELKAGTIERLKTKPGDKIEMDVKRLVRLASGDETR